MTRRSLVCAAALACTAAFQSLAYLPPTDSAGGLTVSILGFDQAPGEKNDRNPRNIGCKEIDVSSKVPVAVTVSNATGSAASGELSVWMNDDWTLDGRRKAATRLSLEPGSVRRVEFTATASSRVLPALYPVHAVFAANSATGAPPHAIAVFRAKTENRAFTLPKPPNYSELSPGQYRLDSRFAYSVSAKVNGETRIFDDSQSNSAEWGGFFSETGRYGYNGVPENRRRGFTCHPPYKKGAGEIFCDFTFSIAAGNKCRFSFANALQVVKDGKNPGDGVRMRVLVRDEAAGGDFREVFSRDVTKAGEWVDGSADLSAFAGKKITLRLAVDPGPKMKTGWDGCAWADPVIEVGRAFRVMTEADWKRMEKAAVEKACRALKRGSSAEKEGEYLLSEGGEKYGAGVVPGEAGILDGVIAFSDGRSSVAFRGFECEVDGERRVFLDDGMRCAISAEKGTLKVAWDMRGVKRTPSGSPRFTRLAIGPANAKPVRIYGGFGWVYENPGEIRLDAGGFTLSTRHGGTDFEGGISVVQAVDVPPVAYETDSAKNVSRMVSKNDTVFSFVPSAKGAFAAARRFASTSGYRASPGQARVCGKTCIDHWGADYTVVADRLRALAKYGLGGSLYVHHNWQRWGYDYRLPDVYPPKGDRAAFDAMVEAARAGGIVFAPHDNFIDYYPDADDFTYDAIIFKPDGRPVEAWYNWSRRARSYRWLPSAVHGKVERNMRQMRAGFRPEALFIDVFTASMPPDTYDRHGTFRPAKRSAEEWGKVFDDCRRHFGVKDAIMVSEAGHDQLVGHIDAGQADHFMPERVVAKGRYTACERVPWHDIVTHGKMTLFGGGLGPRYCQPNWDDAGDRELHGYGSDDYFCTTVMGGRSPMTDIGMCTAVKTHWLLGDVCSALAHGTFDALDFCGDVHKMHSRFSTGEAWVNRGEGEWTVRGMTLPQYGFFARARGGVEAGVVLKDGVRCAFSKRPGHLFVDARPRLGPSVPSPFGCEVSGCDTVSPSRLRIKLKWRLAKPIPQDHRPFVHWLDATGKIVYQTGISDFPQEARSTVGVWEKSYLPVNVPSKLPDGEYFVRFGFFSDSSRLVIRGNDDGTRRIHAGCITVSRVGGKPTVSWRRNVASRDVELGVNAKGVVVDFGGIRSNGAFGFDFPANGDWLVTPVPGLMDFEAEMDLAKLGRGGAKVKSVKAVDPQPDAMTPEWESKGGLLSLKADARAFAYRISFE